jgi:hypothetical protein
MNRQAGVKKAMIRLAIDLTPARLNVKVLKTIQRSPLTIKEIFRWKIS